MVDKSKQDKIPLIMADRDKITEALARGVRNALLKHKQAGNSLPTWRDGQVVWIPPEQILVDEDNP